MPNEKFQHEACPSETVGPYCENQPIETRHSFSLYEVYSVKLVPVKHSLDKLPS